jgi:hypothetical protein
MTVSQNEARSLRDLAQAARTATCPLCWAGSGRCCTIKYAARLIDEGRSDETRLTLGLAQVYAMLALAAATGLSSPGKDERGEWQRVAGACI